MEIAVDAVQGYPFFVQMMGSELWEANPTASRIDRDQACAAVARATADAQEMLFAPILNDLRASERSFLKAMAAAGGEAVTVAAIQAGLKRSSSQTAQLRRRLIAAEVIEPAGHGTLRFAIPGLCRHLLTAAEG